MKPTVLLLCVAATTVFWNPGSAETADREIVSAPAAASKLELRGLAVGSDGAVTGTVFNGSGVAIKDVELLVSHVWSWRDERHPGENNPGRSSYINVSGEIPASGSMAFSYIPEPALPMRTDGRFETTVAVHSFTEIEN
jgi:hypothetical protein